MVYDTVTPDMEHGMEHHIAIGLQPLFPFVCIMQVPMRINSQLTLEQHLWQNNGRVWVIMQKRVIIHRLKVI